MKKLLTTARLFVVTTIAIVCFIPPFIRAQETKQYPTASGQAEREAMYYRYLDFASYIKGGSVQPHWMADGSSFWYAEGAPTNTVIWKVVPKANTKTPLFDTPRLRKALTPVLGHQPPYQGLPFGEFTFLDREKAVKFMAEGKEFILQLDTYTISQVPVLSEQEKSRMVPRTLKGIRGISDVVVEVLSPDGRWFATLKNHNLWLRSAVDGRSEVQLTTDGIEDYEWNRSWFSSLIWWSPDSSKLAAMKADYRKMPKFPIIDWLKSGEQLEWVQYSKIGEPEPENELFIVDIRSKRRVRIGAGADITDVTGWRPDGSALVFSQRRPEAVLELMAADPETGTARVVLTDSHRYRREITWLDDGDKFIRTSERDGWIHLYLYSSDGNLIRRLTEGAFPVVDVVAVHEKAGWVYFTAHGDPERPYDTHLYRVSLEGTGFARLTEATGQHAIQFAPSKEFFIDTHSTVARPPVVELRRADGTLLQVLSRANVEALRQELKWMSPEEFVVKAADGQTDLYGVLWKPFDFEPNKKYPVIEVIYAGSQSSVVPTFFTDYGAYYGLAPALAQLGFITFMVDGRGTPERGKVFQDVARGNVGRHEIPDHVAALKQLTEKRAYMDLGRVGIIGHSAGGYFATRAMFLAPDVYHVGVASAAEVVLEHGASFWFMGPPENNKEAYEYASNLRLAGNLKGKLLLIHGTSDTVVPFYHTMKMVDALIRASKPFDLVVLPQVGHSSRAMPPYWREAIRRYFQDHLKP